LPDFIKSYDHKILFLLGVLLATGGYQGMLQRLGMISEEGENEGVRMQVPTEVYRTVEEKAMQNKTYPNDRLSEGMQQEMINKASRPDLNFSDGRFQIEERVMKRSEKKRKYKAVLDLK
jgi:hypothetical protein